MSELTQDQKTLITKLCDAVEKLRELQKASDDDGERHKNFLKATAFVLAGIVAALTALTAATISVVGGNDGETKRQLLLSAAFGELLSWLVVGVILGSFLVVLLQCLRLFQSRSPAKSKFSIAGGAAMALMILLGYFIAEAGICAGLAAPLQPKSPSLELQKEVPCPLSFVFSCQGEGERWSENLKDETD